MTAKSLDDRALEILKETKAHRVPVPIELIAHRLNLTIEAAELGSDISGMLVTEGARGAIGFNSMHAPVRQRFTVAHEVAHYVLHVKKNRKSQFFVDRYVMYRQDGISSAGTDRNEVEANRFGAALLMPSDLVQREIQKHDLDLDDDEAVAFLAKQFVVSSAAMTNRLMSLGLMR